MITRQKADFIVDDLLKKYPTGPRGRFTKHDYEPKEEYCRRYNDYKTYYHVVKRHQHWESYGYGDEVLMMVFEIVRKCGGYRPYAKQRWPDAGGTAISRRVNRIEKRVSAAVDRFKKSEGHGIFEVKNESGISIYVIATTKNSAAFLGKTMLASAGFNNDRYLYAAKITVASSDILRSKMEGAIASAERKMISHRTRIKDSESSISAIERLVESISIMQGGQEDTLSNAG